MLTKVWVDNPALAMGTCVVGAVARLALSGEPYVGGVPLMCFRRVAPSQQRQRCAKLAVVE